MSLLTTIHAAQRGLKVSSEGINVVGHNTANATTEGYSRRTMVTTTMHPLQRGGHWLGQGAQTKMFKRHTDVLVEQQIVGSHGRQSESKQAYETMRLYEAWLSDGTSSSIVDSYNGFIRSLQQLTEDPGDTIYRSQLLDDAQNFTNNVKNTSQFMQTSLVNIREEMDTMVDNVNASLASIAEFNKRIQSNTGTMSNSDLMDQRDQIIADLSRMVGLTANFKPDGTATVFIDNFPAVQDGAHRTFEYGEDSNGRPQLFLATNSGKVEVTSGLSGHMGGKLTAYDAAQAFLTDMDTFVTDFATDMNTQHASGFDLNGTAGGDFFSFNATNPSTSFEVDSTLLSDVTLIAAAGASTAEFGDRDNLDLMIDIDDLAIFSSGAHTPRQFLTEMYSDLSRKVANAENDYFRETTRMDDMFELRQSISGVDMDEEAMKLMEYQASYEAAARVLTVTNQLLGDLMNIA